MSKLEGLSAREGKLQESASRVAIPVLDLEPQDMDSFGYLRTYWYILRKRYWTILSVALIATVLAAIITYRTTPI